MNTFLDIFISSKMVELKSERQALYKLLPSIDFADIKLRAWVFEGEAPASNKAIRDVYLKALENSALYIGLFWNEYGEYTVDEFEHATKWGIDRHIYVKNVATEQRQDKLREFLNKLGNVEYGVTAKWFSTVDELCNAVRDSITVWLEERMIRRPAALSAIFAKDADDILERPKKLFGRDDLIVQSNKLLDEGEPILLHGFGGMGKTALAAEIVARRIDAGNGPALWLKAGDGAPEILFEALSRPFNLHREIAKYNGDSKLQAVRQILKEQNVKLLVLDDVWNTTALAQIMKALPRYVTLLATARQRYPILQNISVDRLDRTASLLLLSFYPHIDFVGNGGANDLCSKLGDSPFAVRVASMVMNKDKLTPQQLLTQIEQVPHDLKSVKGFAEEGQENVAALLEVSLNALYMSGKEGREAHSTFLAFGALFAPNTTPELMAMYRNWKKPGFWGGAITPEFVMVFKRGRNRGIFENLIARKQAASQEEISQTASALDELEERGLVDQAPQIDNTVKYYRIHDLAHSYARAKTADEHRHQAVDACLAYSWKYAEPVTSNFSALRPEIDNFLGAASWALRFGRYKDVERFGLRLYQGMFATPGFLSLQGYDYLAVEFMKLSIASLEKQGDRDNMITYLGNLGVAYGHLGQYEKARECNEQALALARELKSERGQVTALAGIAESFSGLEHYEEAVEYLQQALAMARKTNYRRVYGLLLSNLANAYRHLGQMDKAIEIQQEALKVGLKGGHSKDYELGISYMTLGQYEQAIQHFEQALNASRTLGDRREEGMALGNLGACNVALGEFAQAAKYLEQAITIRRGLKDRDGEARDLLNLGVLHMYQGRHEEAISFYEKALAIFQDIGARHLAQKARDNIAAARAMQSGSQ